MHTTGRHIVVLLATEDGREIISKHCRSAGVDLSLFQELVDAELEQIGKLRKAGLWDNFDNILDQMDAM